MIAANSKFTVEAIFIVHDGEEIADLPFLKTRSTIHKSKQWYSDSEKEMMGIRAVMIR